MLEIHWKIFPEKKGERLSEPSTIESFIITDFEINNNKKNTFNDCQQVTNTWLPVQQPPF